jgi:tetratricopeptide (TPR) repeat protein
MMAGGFLVLAGLIWGSMSLLQRTRQTTNSNAWREFVQALRAGDAEELRLVAADYRTTPAAARALQAAGMLTLESGVTSILTDRDGALESLKLAQEDLESALNLAKSDNVLVPQIHLGLAQVYEAKNELDKAKAQYNQILESTAFRPFHRIAQQRRNFLEQEETQEFANWFAKQKVATPRASSTGGSSVAPPSPHDDLPSVDLMLPGRGELNRSELEQKYGPLDPPTEGTADDSKSEAGEQPETTEKGTDE